MITKRELQSIEMRKKGITFRKIAESFGISTARARQIVISGENKKKKQKQFEEYKNDFKKKCSTHSIKEIPIAIFANTLTIRAKNAIMNDLSWKVKTIGDLISMQDNELLKTKNLGRKTLNEIKFVIANLIERES